MIHLVTHYWPENKYAEEMFAASSEFNRAVAERLGWNFIADSKRRVPNLGIHREKTAILVEAMQDMADGDLVLRVDGDCLIVGKNTSDIFTELGVNDVGLTKVRGRWTCGVVAYRVNAVTREMWLLHRDHVHDPAAKPGWDGHLCASCTWPEWKRGVLCGSRKTTMVELHRKWNDRLRVLNDTEIVGYHGYDILFKRAKIMDFVHRGSSNG